MLLAHPTGVQHSNNIHAERRLTGTLSVTGNRHVQSRMANFSGAPPDPEMKAPAKAGTNARAHLSKAADRLLSNSRIWPFVAIGELIPAIVLRVAVEAMR
jgi:hypothetical protein